MENINCSLKDNFLTFKCVISERIVLRTFKQKLQVRTKCSADKKLYQIIPPEGGIGTAITKHVLSSDTAIPGSEYSCFTFFVSSCILYCVVCLTFTWSWRWHLMIHQKRQNHETVTFFFLCYAWTWTWTSKIRNINKKTKNKNTYKLLKINTLSIFFIFLFLVYYMRQRTLSKDKVQAAGDSA